MSIISKRFTQKITRRALAETVDEPGNWDKSYTNSTFLGYMEPLQGNIEFLADRDTPVEGWRLYCETGTTLAYGDLILYDSKTFSIKGIVDYTVGNNPHVEVELVLEI